MIGIPEDMFELSAAHKEMVAEQSGATSLPDRYIKKKDGSVDGFAGYLKADGIVGSGTSAAFSAFLLGRSGLLKGRRVSEDCKKAIVQQVQEKCITTLTLLKNEFLSQALTSARSGPEALSNYKLPIYVAGALSLARSSLLNVNEQEKAALKAGVKELCQRLRSETPGVLTRVGGYSSNEPSAYYTYWAVQGLLEALTLNGSLLDLSQEEQQTATDCLRASRQWSEGALAALIADHHAGIKSRFDPIELICVAANATLAFPNVDAPAPHAASPSPSDEAVRLTIHGLDILFKKYFNEGSFARSRPVYSDDKNNSIFCSTAEALFYLLNPGAPHPATYWHGGQARHLAILKPHLGSLLSAFRLLRRNRSLDGYVPDLDGSFGVQPHPNAFSTISALSFMELVSNTVDNALDDLARAALRVPEFAIDDVVREKREYPEELGKILKHYVVSPLRNGERKAAYYSMILHGPPGTSKTTLAKKLAQDLGWPLLEITQRDFLVDGTAFIDAAADRIFSLVGLLKNVVVLFDELEELIGSRESADDEPKAERPEREGRLLTTSMLPRIHDLRDKKRIVFIFATNRIGTFDKAATRPGRFDIIQLVPPPDETALKKHLEFLCTAQFPEGDVQVATRVKKNVRKLVKNAKPKKGMTYKDIELFFNEMIRQVIDEGNPLKDVGVDKLMEDFKSIDDKTIYRFEKLRGDHDRP